jgi:Ca2+-binding RTX toxin-like protein
MVESGADTMNGGLGDDTFIVDNAGDYITELAGQGTDTVISSVTRYLGSNQENLTLTGASAINGYGFERRQPPARQQRGQPSFR